MTLGSDIIGTLAARDWQIGSQYVNDNKLVVEDATKLEQTWWDGGDQADTLTVTSNEQRMPDKARLQAVVEPVVMRQREGKPGGGKGPLLSDVSLTLATGNDQYLFQPALEDATKVVPVNDEVIVFQPGAMIRQGGAVWEGGPVPTLRAEAKRGDNEPHIAQPVETYVKNQVPNVAQAIPIHDQATRWSGLNGDREVGKGNGLGVGEPGDPMNTLTQGDRHAVAQPEGPELAVRRLTPLECERLMGWPDDHTRWAADGTEMKDTARYKMCGNGIASPVAEWVGRHVLLADAYLKAVQP